MRELRVESDPITQICWVSKLSGKRAHNTFLWDLVPTKGKKIMVLLVSQLLHKLGTNHFDHTRATHMTHVDLMSAAVL